MSWPLVRLLDGWSCSAGTSMRSLVILKSRRIPIFTSPRWLIIITSSLVLHVATPIPVPVSFRWRYPLLKTCSLHIWPLSSGPPCAFRSWRLISDLFLVQTLSTLRLSPLPVQWSHCTIELAVGVPLPSPWQERACQGGPIELCRSMRSGYEDPMVDSLTVHSLKKFFYKICNVGVSKVSAPSVPSSPLSPLPLCPLSEPLPLLVPPSSKHGS